jgi:hypothetical protein
MDMPTSMVLCGSNGSEGCLGTESKALRWSEKNEYGSGRELIAQWRFRDKSEREGGTFLDIAAS